MAQDGSKSERARKQQTLIFHRFWNDFGLLGVSWEPLGGLLGASWGLLGPSWGALRSFRGALGAILEEIYQRRGGPLLALPLQSASNRLLGPPRGQNPSKT